MSKYILNVRNKTVNIIKFIFNFIENSVLLAIALLAIAAETIWKSISSVWREG